MGREKMRQKERRGEEIGKREESRGKGIGREEGGGEEIR